MLTGKWDDLYCPTRCMTMKFLPDDKLHEEVQNPQKILKCLIKSVNYGSAKFKNSQISCFYDIQIPDMVTNIQNCTVLDINMAD